MNMNINFNRRVLNTALASALALAGTGFVSNAYAAATSSTATAKVVTPITNTAAGVLAFGNFSKGAGGTVSVANGGARTATGAILAGGTVTAARFNIAGDSGSTYGITYNTPSLANTTTVTAGVTGNMALSLTSNLDGAANSTGPVASGTLTGGSQSIYVGGTLTVDAAQTVGAYSGSVTVTVEYN